MRSGLVASKFLFRIKGFFADLALELLLTSLINYRREFLSFFEWRILHERKGLFQWSWLFRIIDCLIFNSEMNRFLWGYLCLRMILILNIIHLEIDVRNICEGRFSIHIHCLGVILIFFFVSSKMSEFIMFLLDLDAFWLREIVILVITLFVTHLMFEERVKKGDLSVFLLYISLFRGRVKWNYVLILVTYSLWCIFWWSEFFLYIKALLFFNGTYYSWEFFYSFSDQRNLLIWDFYFIFLFFYFF